MRPALGWLSLVALALGCSGPGALEQPGAVTQAVMAELPSPPTAAATASPRLAPAAPPSATAVAAEVTRAERIELTFVGDIVFGARFRDAFYPVDVPRQDPLAGVSALLASDLAVGNLETTVLSALPSGGKGDRRFAATPDQAAVLLRHGLRTVTIANNHIHDFGVRGLEETPRLLGELGFQVLGAPQDEGPAFRIETQQVKGWKIGFVAGTARLNVPQRRGERPIVPFARDEKLVPALEPLIRQARADHDLVVVVVHWGEEYEEEPRPWQVAAAHAFVDAGADAVIAHHPHVLQPIERYEGAVIAYSLGNFVFPNVRETSRDTGVLRLGFARSERAGDPACLDRAELAVALMKRHDKHYGPEPLGAKPAEKLLRRLARASKRAPISTAWTIERDRLVGEPSCRKP